MTDLNVLRDCVIQGKTTDVEKLVSAALQENQATGVILATLREAMDLDIGELTPADTLLGRFDPSAHLSDDLFGQKIAFIVLLNFPRYSLEEKRVMSEAWGRREWAMARMGDRFQSRVPADVWQELSTAQAAAEAYIASADRSSPAGR